MTLLLTAFAAAVCTAAWYKNAEKNELRIDVLCWMYWGASIMWFVDAIFEYAELGSDFFTPELSDVLNDTFLGLSVIALGLVIWTAVLLIKDPKGVVKAKLFKK